MRAAQGTARKRVIGGGALAVLLVTVIGVLAARGTGVTAVDQAQQLREEIDQHYEDLQASGEVDPAPKPDNPQELAPSPQPETWPEGVFEDGEYPSGDYVFQNRWGGIMNGSDVSVYAGAFASDPKQGLLLVWTRSESTYEVTTKEYPTDRPGPLRIESAKGTVLTLSDGAGDVLTFDVASDTFGDAK